MRLAKEQVETIRDEIRRFDPAAEIYLFGSRADDNARGGDIDVLALSKNTGLRDLLRMRRAILDRIGWQQLDLILRRPEDLEEPFIAQAVRTGIKL
jgi:uncharacterized protein